MITQSHLDEAQLNGYLHHTLTDAEREAMDQHLAHCSACRAHLAEHKAMQRHLCDELKATLHTLPPPPTMQFSELAPRIQQSRLLRAWRRYTPAFPATVAALGLLLALMGLWGNVDFAQGALVPGMSPMLPVTACLLFGLPVATQYQAKPAALWRKRWLAALVVLVWLGTSVVGLYEIFLLRELWLRIYARYWQRYWPAVTVGGWGIVALSLVWIAVFMGGAEYHYRHFAQRRSWRLLAWTILGELAILVLAFFV